MFDLEQMTRDNIRTLKPYKSARDEFEGDADISLDANENPYGFGLNRYPDRHVTALRNAFASFRSIQPDQVIFGNGSDEIIDLLIRCFCEPERDHILIFPPTFGMYEVCANTCKVNIERQKLTEDFQIDWEATAPKLSDPTLKLIFICTPNNPTGNRIDPKTILKICEAFHGIVVVDEAYIDFSGGSLVDKLDRHPNLLIMQTFSKALGMAGIRLGVGIANKPVLDVLDKIKAPYNINALTQEKGVEALSRPTEIKRLVRLILDEKERVKKALEHIPSVTKIYPSDAGFLLVAFEDEKAIYRKLLNKGIVVRDRSVQIPNTHRITIGTPEENDRLIAALKGEHHEVKGRKGTCLRKTSETEIKVAVNLDDATHASISTGVPFFDHMLDQLARHGTVGLDVLVKGDTRIDPHHTIEDTALAMGVAFNEALKDRKGIERYGFLLPMDDCLAQVAVDFGGRPQMVWDATFFGIAVGDLPTEMIPHFFKSFADAAKCNLNIKAEGDNDHHKAESIFKAFARAVKMAVKKDKNGLMPSTKGMI